MGLMSAVMIGVGTAATTAFTSALTTALMSSGARLVRGERPGEALRADEVES